MAMLLTNTKRSLSDAEARARDFLTQDAYADYSYHTVSVVPDTNPSFVDRLHGVLARAGLTYSRLLYGCSSAGASLETVFYGPSPTEGDHAVALVVTRGRIPLGDRPPATIRPT